MPFALVGSKYEEFPSLTNSCSTVFAEHMVFATEITVKLVNLHSTVAVQGPTQQAKFPALVKETSGSESIGLRRQLPVDRDQKTVSSITALASMMKCGDRLSREGRCI